MTWDAMQSFTAKRDQDSEDEIWFVQHPPVYTLGLNGKPEHVLDKGDIPVIKCDRGGQVTYHGPGQLLVYFMLDLQARGIGVKSLVHKMEGMVIEVLRGYGLKPKRRKGAPGVYVGDAKIAALGLRIKHGCSYHGLSLNVDMDLEPFQRINPCGFEGLKAVQVVDLCPGVTYNRVVRDMKDVIIRYFLNESLPAAA